ncbi:hypothetical protein [Xylanibacter muris]|nr:hypothetical protein [Xylanibacter muris]
MDERFHPHTHQMLPHSLHFSPLWGVGVALLFFRGAGWAIGSHEVG